MWNKLWESPWQVKAALLLLVMSVLVDFASAVLSVLVDGVFVGISIWILLSFAPEPNKKD